jgi:uncharacterized protein
MKILRASGYRRMPWKNGGGETAEIAASPSGAALEAIDWRLSMAVVASDGPFSSFLGVDRTLTILDGDGLRLVVDHAVHELTRASAPLAFPADAPTTATLIGGTVTDMNVMTRRAGFRHTVERIELTGSTRRRTQGATVAIVCCEGEIGCDVDGSAAGWLGFRDCGLIEGGDVELMLTSARPSVALLVSIYRTAATPE